MPADTENWPIRASCSVKLKMLNPNDKQLIKSTNLRPSTAYACVGNCCSSGVCHTMKAKEPGEMMGKLLVFAFMAHAKLTKMMELRVSRTGSDWYSASINHVWAAEPMYIYLKVQIPCTKCLHIDTQRSFATFMVSSMAPTHTE